MRAAEMLRVVEMEMTSTRLRISIIDSTDACIDAFREATEVSTKRMLRSLL
jgi:hypothetical protein